MKIITKTARLTLAEFTLEDGPFILRLVNEPSWLQYIGDRHVYTLADAEKYLSEGSMKSYQERGFGFWKVILNETGIIIGTAGLAKRDYLDDIDLGFAFLPDYTGQGYALESAKAVMDFADSNLGLDKLVAFTSPDNIPSIRLLEKLGFGFEKQFLLDGEKLNLYAHGKLEDKYLTHPG